MSPISWSPPRTWSVGDVVTAAELNAIRDDLKEIWRLAVPEVQVTSPVTVTASAASSATTVATLSAFTADGTSPVYVECGMPNAGIGSGETLSFELFDGSTSRGRLGYAEPGASGSGPISLRSRMWVPSAASHTLSVRAWTDNPNQSIDAGAGGSAGTTEPIWIRLWSKGGA